MLGRIVEVAEDNRYLSISRGFLVISQHGEECARTPINDIGALIGNANGLVFSNNVLTALAERGAPIVLCARNHRPSAVVWPIDSHHLQARRISVQASLSRPSKKRLWQQLIRRKILRQALTLESAGRPHKVVKRLAGKVRSGDTQNIEAQAARHYWRLLFGPEFRRDVDESGVNALLNYGYAILRAATARAVVSTGLHPSLGIFHRNAQNSFQLVDDVMEPYRPIVDAAVLGLKRRETTQINSSTKRDLALLMYRDFCTISGVSPLIRCIEETTLSLSRSFDNPRTEISFPDKLEREDLDKLIHGKEDPHVVGVSTHVDDCDV